MEGSVTVSVFRHLSYMEDESRWVMVVEHITARVICAFERTVAAAVVLKEVVPHDACSYLCACFR